MSKGAGVVAIASIVGGLSAAAYFLYNKINEDEEKERKRRAKRPPPAAPAAADAEVKLPYVDVDVDTRTLEAAKVSLVQACVAIYPPWRRVKPVWLLLRCAIHRYFYSALHR